MLSAEPLCCAVLAPRRTLADMATTLTAPPDTVLRHSPVENVLGVATGVVLASVGVHLLSAAHAVTGGTAGLALLLSYATALPFGVLYCLVNVPFFLLAIRSKGWPFTLRSIVAVAALSAVSSVLPALLPLGEITPAAGVVIGNLLVGVALLILFRHGTSLGGFGILALVLQERRGWRAGYVQMTLDIVVVVSALAVVPVTNVLVSAAGAILLNLVLALNHRPGRYLAH